ncbi:MAG: hypothetical protein IPL47_11850 [Phyllobacteriaceae bacterium]|nr:hypothetical protein [Phyllobacteriaceae bacterium]
MAAYTIDIERKGRDGLLEFRSGSVKVSTRCWWDPGMIIDAKPGGYTGISTTMATKTDSVTGEPRPAIWFGKGVSYNGGARRGDGAFIHEGTGASWSDGCVVIARIEMMRLIEAIKPKGQYNVTINITDARSSGGTPRKPVA